MNAKEVKQTINTRLGGEHVKLASEAEQAKKVATGLLSFDEQTNGGLPMGMPISIQGRPSVGKSAFCYYMAGRAIEQHGGVAFVLQTEPGFDPVWADQCGLPAKGCIFYEGDKLNVSLQLILNIVKNDKPTAVIFDSISMLSANPDESMTDSKSHGERAKPNNEFFRRLCGAMDKDNPPLFLYIEHLHPIIGKPGLTTTGGETKGYANGMAIRLSVESYISAAYTSYNDKKKELEIPVQSRVVWEIRKSKSCPFKGTGTYSLGLRETEFCKSGQIDDYDEMIVRGTLNGHIKKAGSWFTVIDTGEKYQGADKLKAAIDPSTFREIVLRPRPTGGEEDGKAAGEEVKAGKRGGGAEGRLRGRKRAAKPDVSGGDEDGNGQVSDDTVEVAGKDHEGSDE